VVLLPSYAPDINPAEGVWANMKNGLGNLAARNVDQLAAVVRNRLKRIQYRPAVISGSSPRPDSCPGPAPEFDNLRAITCVIGRTTSRPYSAGRAWIRITWLRCRRSQPLVLPTAILTPPLPRVSRRDEHYCWSARWGGQGRLPFAPKTGKRPGWAAEIHHEIELLPAALWSGWPDLNRRPLRPELRAQPGKSGGQRRSGTSGAFARDTIAVFDRV
jgi:hypothetical protein